MEIRETPFVLIARVMVKSGKVEEYMKIASTVDEAVEKTEPGMLFHNFDSDPTNELKFVWTEIYKNDEALIFHINNPPVGEYVEKHLELAESIEIEIYGQLADDTIDILTQAWGEAKIPFKLFKTTRVGYFRQSIFGWVQNQKFFNQKEAIFLVLDGSGRGIKFSLRYNLIEKECIWRKFFI